MRSELFVIPFEVGGVPIFGVGVLLAAWLVLAAAMAWRWSRQPDGVAEMKANLPVFAVVAAAILLLPSLLENGLPIRGYGMMLVLAASTGLAMAIHRGRQRGVDADTILSLSFAMFVLGILGARLFFVIEYWDAEFAGKGLVGALKKALMFTEGGLVVYGSLIGGAAAFAWFCRQRRLPVLAVADLLAPSLAVGLAIGRVGCLLNGCCFGGVCDAPWAVTFPRLSSPERFSPPYERQLTSGQLHGFRWAEDPSDGRCVVTRVDLEPAPAGLTPGAVIGAINDRSIASAKDLRLAIIAAYNAQTPITLGLAPIDGAKPFGATLPAAPIRARSLPVHPTQIYSAVNAGLLGAFLWFYYPIRRRDGEVAALLLTIYPVGRFLLEAIRIDESSFFGTGLSISQNVSIALLAAMTLGWALLWRQPKRLADFPASEPA